MNRVNNVAMLNKVEQRAVALFFERILAEVHSRLLAVVLFGSRARGPVDPETDMDLLVVLDQVSASARRQISDIAVEVWLECGIFLSVLIWSNEYWRLQTEKRTLLSQSIQREGIVLLERDGVTVGQ